MIRKYHTIVLIYGFCLSALFEPLIAYSEDAPGFALRWGGSGSSLGYFGNPKGLACDALGHVFVADFLNRRIQVFTGNGQLIEHWGPLDYPSDVAIGLDNSVYVVEFQGSQISKFSSSGEFVVAWGQPGTAQGEFQNPESIAIDSRGNVYVVDSGNQRLQQFTDNGEFVRSWGTLGSGPGEFYNPGSVAIDAQDRVYVTDSGNSRIEVFTSTGSYLFEWRFSDSPLTGFAYGICIDKQKQRAYVIDAERDAVFEFTLDGEFVTRWGEYGNGNGYFNGPYDVAVDVNSNVFVADTGNDYIQKFDPRLAPLPPRPDYPAKILLHVSPAPTDSCHPALETCSEAIVTQRISSSDRLFYVYLLVARGNLSSIGGMQCGITYDGNVQGRYEQGIDVLSWTLCGTMEFHSWISPESPDWPATNSGNLITWHSVTNCQLNDIGVAGYFYVATYTPDVMRVIPRPVDNVAAVGDCVIPPNVTYLQPADLGYVSFSTDPDSTGCNPCLQSCTSGSAVKRTTWSAIKALF